MPLAWVGKCLIPSSYNLETPLLRASCRADSISAPAADRTSSWHQKSLCWMPQVLLQIVLAHHLGGGSISLAPSWWSRQAQSNKVHLAYASSTPVDPEPVKLTGNQAQNSLHAPQLLRGLTIPQITAQSILATFLHWPLSVKDKFCGAPKSY